MSNNTTDYLVLAKELANARRTLVKYQSSNKLLEPTNGETFVLGYLTRNKSVNPKELSDVMNVSSARISAIINQLDQKGFVQRQQDLENGRQTIISILPAGMDKHQENLEEFYERAIQFFEKLGPNDAKEYVRLQNRIAEIYSNNND